MNDFALIAEGVTDQQVLENIVLAWFSELDEEPHVVAELPYNPGGLTESKDAQGHGGWTLVREYFTSGKYKQALQLNRYLVVHVDTDIAHELLAGEGKPATAEEQVEAVIAYFRKLIGDEILAVTGHRFLFAIAVDSIECWLLPLVVDRSQAKVLKKTASCLKTVNDELRRKNEELLSKGDGTEKRPVRYARLSSGFGKRRDVEDAAKHNAGFGRFAAQLADVPVPIQDP